MKVLVNEKKELLSDNFYDLNSLQMYYQEISKYKLLSIEEERELFKELKAGSYEAKEKLINSNLRLVVSVAKRYSNYGVSILDLIQEGNLGLIRAVEKFDYLKGFKFSSYAIWWIKRYIRRILFNDIRTIQIPENKELKLSSYLKVKNQLVIELGREPTTDELISRLNISKQELNDLLQIPTTTSSLNFLINDDTKLGDLIVNKNDEVSKVIENIGNLQEVEAIFKNCKLSSLQKEILISRYGLFQKNMMTLQELGEKYGITRERVRQIGDKAIQKIRKSSYIKKLKIEQESTRNYYRLNSIIKEIDKDQVGKIKENLNKLKKDIQIEEIYNYFLVNNVTFISDYYIELVKLLIDSCLTIEEIKAVLLICFFKNQSKTIEICDIKRNNYSKDLQELFQKALNKIFEEGKYSEFKEVYQRRLENNKEMIKTKKDKIY